MRPAPCGAEYALPKANVYPQLENALNEQCCRASCAREISQK